MCKILFTALCAMFFVVNAGVAQTPEQKQTLTPKCKTPIEAGTYAENCWLKVKGRNDCYVWARRIGETGEVTWSGSCPSGYPDGRGQIAVLFLIDFYGDVGMKAVQEDEGSYVDGKREGRWTTHSFGYSSGGTSKRGRGEFKNGNKHGYWYYDGEFKGAFEEEGEYVDGKKHGTWLFRSDDWGDKEETYVHGVLQE